jgi:hypothetical protein
MKAKIINGSWINDDVDILPTIKLRISSESNTQLKLTATSIAICWLKWGFMVSFCRIKDIAKENKQTSEEIWDEIFKSE